MPYSKHTNNILISMYHGTTVTIDQFDIYTQNRLFNDKYIVRNSAFGSPYVYLSDAGKAYVESLLQAKADKKAQVRHDWSITIFSTIAGAVAGLITSLIFWLITT